MHDRFTDRLRRVMTLANREAQRFNQTHIDSEYLLLGFIAEGSGVGVTVIKSLGVDLYTLRKTVESRVKSQPDMHVNPRLPFTQRATNVLESAADEARRLGHKFVGTEHLLLGLMCEQNSVAAEALTQHGLSLDRVRAEVLNLLGRGAAGEG